MRYVTRQPGSACRQTEAWQLASPLRESPKNHRGQADAGQPHAPRYRRLRVRSKFRFGGYYPRLAPLAWQTREPENGRGCRRAARADDADSGQPGHRVVPWCRTKTLVPRVPMQLRLSRCATTIRCQHPFERAACCRTTGSAIRATGRRAGRLSKRPPPPEHETRAFQ